MSDSLETRLARAEQEIVSTGREIRDIKTRLERSDEILSVVHRISTQNESILEQIKDHNERLRAIETVPRRRWEDVVSTVIKTLVTAGAGALIALVLK